MEKDFVEQQPPAPETGRDTRRPRKRHWVLWLLVLAAAAYAIWACTSPSDAGAGAGGGKRGGGRGAKIQVVAAPVTQGDIDVVFKGLGTVTPLYSVTITARVTGQLMDVFFKEGQMVKKGAPLAEIDPRPYQATLDQAEGTLAHDQALLDNANIDAQRYQTLWKQDSISQQILDTQKALVAQDEAQIQTDQGLVETDKLNVEYCHITSPIDGLVGLRLVDPGNQIQTTGSTGLLVVDQVQPITVIFTLPEDDLPAVLKQTQAGKPLKVTAYDREDTTKLAEGTLSSIDNQIDSNTGTVKLRATFSNTDNSLYSNQFVNAHLLVDTHKGVTLAPPAALQLTSGTTFVYLVQSGSGHQGTQEADKGGILAALSKFFHPAADSAQSGGQAGGQTGAGGAQNQKSQIVKVQNVTVGTQNSDEAEITDGLNPGDVVVIDGVDKLQDGSPVIVQMSGSSAPGASPTQGHHHHGHKNSTDGSASGDGQSQSGAPGQGSQSQ